MHLEWRQAHGDNLTVQAPDECASVSGCAAGFGVLLGNLLAFILLQRIAEG